MIVLAESTDSIKVVLGEAKTTNDCQCVAAWESLYEASATAWYWDPCRAALPSNGITPVTLVDGSAEIGKTLYGMGVARKLKVGFIALFNADTVLHNVTVYLDDDGTAFTLWKGDVPAGASMVYEDGTGWIVFGPSPYGYALAVQALTSSPGDGATVYFGNMPKAPTTTAATSKIMIRKAGTLKVAEIYCFSGTAGTNEAWSLYVRVNNSQDYLIQTLSVATSERIFSNAALSIPLAVGDYIEIKGVQPTWATNPLTTIYGGYLYIE